MRRNPHPCLNPMRLTALILALSPLLTTIASAQTVPPSPLPQFEVATIKPVEPNTPHPNDINVYPGGRIVLRGYSLKSLIVTAYNVSYWQLSGGDPWMEKYLYDIEAKPPESSSPARYDLRHTWWRIQDENLREMLQALLIDRFQLKFRRESSTGTVYLLETSGKTALLHPTEAETADHPFGGEGFSGDVGHAGDRWVLYNTSMPQLAKFTSDVVLHQPVLDRTGLTGYFDAKWTQVLTDESSFDGMDSYQFFLRALGLKLTKSTGPVETFVIDHAESPTPN
jgi:uncharacterized protein (TIGR03435 family)